jgi:hypothetical protein
VVWVLIGVGALTAAVAVWLVVALLLRLKALSEAVAALQESMLPVLEDIRRGSEEAQARMDRLQERRTALEPGSVGG